MPNKLAYIDFIPFVEAEPFASGVLDMAVRLKTDPNYLMQVMFSEAKLRADIRNTHYPFYKRLKGTQYLDGYATGLIQFVPDTARSLGTTTWLLEKMTRVEQLKYVEMYFKKAGMVGKLNSYFDVYLVVFFPAAVGHTNDDNWVFQARRILASEVAKANPGININKDEKITMGEFKQYLLNSVMPQFRDPKFGVKRFNVGS